MLDLLPYPLTTGVTATRDGLVFNNAVVRRNDGPNFWEETTGLLNALQQLGKLQAHKNSSDGVVKWTDAAQRLRYREGEPWCTDGGTAVMFYGGASAKPPHPQSLHRLASILCDDAEAFRVLHWCVSHLAQEDSK